MIGHSKNMPPPSMHRLPPVDALGIELSSSEVITVETPPSAYRSLRPAIIESYNSFHNYNELDTRSVTPVAMPQFRPPTPSIDPPIKIEKTAKAVVRKSFSEMKAPQKEELIEIVRTRAQLKAILGVTSSTSTKRPLETSTTPRKRRATIIDLEAPSLTEPPKNDVVQIDSDSLSEIESISEPTRQYIDSSDDEDNYHNITGIDSRYDSSVLHLVHGEYWVPKCCHRYWPSGGKLIADVVKGGFSVIVAIHVPIVFVQEHLALE